MNYRHIRVERKGRVLRVTLDRPEVHNAFNADLIDDLHRAVSEAETDAMVRVVVLSGSGKSFCAGADLGWMSATIDYSREQNVRDSVRMAAMFRALDRCPKPVVGRINGAAVGGGVGVVACMDVAIAAESAKFGLAEVRLGIAPAVISPYVLRRIGHSATRRYFLTGERFTAARAAALGLVHEVVSDEELDATTDRVVEHLLQGGPAAQRACKRLVHEVPALAAAEEDEFTSEVIAALRVGPEGQEGMRAFLEKRQPSWIAGDDPN